MWNSEATSMTTIIAFIPRNVFDDATTKVMGDAFDTAYKALPNDQPGLMHEIMARRIVRAVGKASAMSINCVLPLWQRSQLASSNTSRESNWLRQGGNHRVESQ
jgi:hypothetical protein